MTPVLVAQQPPPSAALHCPPPSSTASPMAVDPGYVVECGICMLLSFLCLPWPFLQLWNHLFKYRIRNSAIERFNKVRLDQSQPFVKQQHAQVKNLHKVFWSVLIVNSLIGIVVSIDIFGAFGLYSIPFRLACFLLFIGNLVIASAEWGVNLLQNARVLKGLSILEDCCDLLIKLSIIGGYYATAVVAWYLMNFQDKVVYAALSVFYVEVLFVFMLFQSGATVSSIHAQALEQTQVYKRNLDLLPYERKMIEERIKQPLSRLILHMMVTSAVLICNGLVGIFLVTVAANFSTASWFTVDTQNHSVTIWFLVGVGSIFFMQVCGILMTWIPILEKSGGGVGDGGDQHLQSDLVSSVSARFLNWTWFLLGQRIFNDVDPDPEYDSMAISGRTMEKSKSQKMRVAS